MHRGGANNAGGAANHGGRAGSGGVWSAAGAGAGGFAETGGVTAQGGGSSDAGASFGGDSGSGGVDAGSGGTGASDAGSSGVCEAGNGGEGGSFWTWDPAACGDFNCGEHGTCVTALNEQHCECKPGFQGTLCDEDIDECAQNPCVGVCLNTIGGFTCQCPAGRAGSDCDLPVFQGIGALSGDMYSEAVGLNRDGTQVLARSYDLASAAASHVVLFDVASGALKKAGPEDVPSCQPVAVNGDGTAVIGNCAQKNYVWKPSGVEYLDGALADAHIMGMSSDGSVLVGTHVVNGGLFAFRADANGLDDLLATRERGGGSPATVSVSADGNIVGAVSTTLAAYVWSKEFGLRRLVGNFECAPQESVVVSGDGSTFSSSGTHRLLIDRGWVSTGPAFRWRGDSIQPGEVGTFAVSDDGSVVLGARTAFVSSGSGVASAYFVRRADGTDRTPELKQLVPSDWQIQNISAISADGKVVAGTGLHNSLPEGWVAHLP